MKGIVIGASSESVFAIESARGMGIEVYAIDGDGNAIGLSYADRADIIDISDVDAVCKYVELNSIDFVIPVALGKFLTTVGQVNDKFNFKGLSYQAAINCVDKWKFHQLLYKNGLRNIESFLYEDQVLNTKYPVIAKPRFGSGSKGVKELASAAEVVEYLQDITDEFIIEEKFIGEEFGVDCQIINGKFDMILLRKKINTPPPYMQAVAYYSTFDSLYEGDLHKDLEDKIHNATSLIGLDNCLIHVDILVSENEIFIIELSGRPSGHNLHNKFTIYATNYDMIGNYLNYQLTGKSLCSIKPRKCAIHYFNIKLGVVRSLPEVSMFSNLLEYDMNINIGDRIEIITDGQELMKRGFFIIEGKSVTDIEMRAEKILNTFEIGD